MKAPTASSDEPASVTPILRVPCEVYSRIVGYLRPVANWHAGKQQEFRDRKVYRVPEGIKAHGLEAEDGDDA